MMIRSQKLSSSQVAEEVITGFCMANVYLQRFFAVSRQKFALQTDSRGGTLVQV